MKEEQWKSYTIDGECFWISNYGLIWSLQSDGFVGHLIKGRWAHRTVLGTLIFADKVVYELFNQPLSGQSVLHIDYDRQNDYVGNLDKKTKAEVISYYNKELWKRKKNRGVTKFNNPRSKKKWRSIITFGSSRQEVKYFKTRKEAQADFIQRWEQKYGEKYVASY